MWLLHIECPIFNVLKFDSFKSHRYQLDNIFKFFETSRILYIDKLYMCQIERFTLLRKLYVRGRAFIISAHCLFYQFCKMGINPNRRYWLFLPVAPTRYFFCSFNETLQIRIQSCFLLVERIFLDWILNIENIFPRVYLSVRLK